MTHSPDLVDLVKRVMERARYVCESCLIAPATEVYPPSSTPGWPPPTFELHAVCGACLDALQPSADETPPGFQTQPIIDPPARGYDAQLRCPRCSNEYLHHAGLNAYSQDAIAIRFWCENCCNLAERPFEAPFELTIAQHKGATYLRWRLVGGG